MISSRQARGQIFRYEGEGVDWKRAGKIGFFVGCIFLLATAGNPWGVSALIVPTVMGREVFPASASHFSLGYTIIHLALAVAYSLGMAPVVQKFKITGAILMSIPFGLLFYGFNVGLFHYFLPDHGNSGEIGVLFTNVAFAILVSAAYRGVARGRQRERGAQ